uniref:Cystin-1 n=1 Tax=Callorhinus ursinus TaxID=34884 RepID=A0A3Q7P1Y9_CALUR|nr:cystin-1 [Callorhinus ursinus]
MGSGSSRSGRALRRLRSPDSRPAGPGGAASEGGTRPLVSATAAAAAREEAREAEAAEGAADPDPDRDPGPADGGDETLRLLDQLLAESAAWGPGELVPRGPARPKPAAGAGSRVSSKQSADEHPESSRVSREGAAPGSVQKPYGLTAAVIVPLREALAQIVQGAPDLTCSPRNRVPCEGKSPQRPERQSSAAFFSSTAEEAVGGHCPTAGGGQLWAADLASTPASSTQPDPRPHPPSCQRNPGGSHGRSEKPSGILAISYDYSEEELMASIEQEYCR